MSHDHSGKPSVPQTSDSTESSANQGTPSEHDQTEHSVASALSMFNLFRLTASLQEAMVWLRTACVLDDKAEHVKMHSPVNLALWQVVGDTLMRSEAKILHCGNILPEHGELLDIAGDALDLLTQRLPVSGDGARGFRTSNLLRAHIEALFVSHKHKLLGDSPFQPSRAREAADFTDTVLKCIELLEELQLPAGTLALTRPAEVKARMIDVALGNAEGQIFGYVLARLTDYDQVAYFVSHAQRLLDALPAPAGSDAVAYETNHSAVKAALATTLSKCQSMDRKATRTSLKQARVKLQQLGYKLSGK